MNSKLLTFGFCFILSIHVSLAADTECDPKCTFKPKKLTSKNIGSFPTTCTKVCCSRISIDGKANLTQQQLTNAFKNMKTLIGGVEVSNTKYTNAKFFAGLQNIVSDFVAFLCRDNLEMVELGMTNLISISGFKFSVDGNLKMKQLNLPKLQNFKCLGESKAIIYIKNNHPADFCISSKEIKAFMLDKKYTEVQATGRICAPAKTTAQICKTPAENCVEVHGDLNIGASFAVKQVKSLKFLYGSLIVKNSNLTNFKFLGNLTHIVQLDEKRVAIDVQGNKKLTSVAFPKLQGILANTWDTDGYFLDAAIFKNNHKSLLEDVKTCNAITSALYENEEEFPKFDGKTCKQLGAALKKTTKKATTKKSAG